MQTEAETHILILIVLLILLIFLLLLLIFLVFARGDGNLLPIDPLGWQRCGNRRWAAEIFGGLADSEAAKFFPLRFAFIGDIRWEDGMPPSCDEASVLSPVAGRARFGGLHGRVGRFLGLSRCGQNREDQDRQPAIQTVQPFHFALPSMSRAWHLENLSGSPGRALEAQLAKLRPLGRNRKLQPAPFVTPAYCRH